MDFRDRVIKWLLSGDTGVSSEAIVAHMMGVNKRGEFSDYPSDGGDFGRCARLLKAIPEFKLRLSEMNTRGRQWRALVKHWDELTAMYEKDDEAIYKRMREILKSVPDKNTIDLGFGSIQFKVK